MATRLELRVLAALSGGAAPAHVVARRVRAPQARLYPALARLEERGFLLRLRGRCYRLTRRGLAFLRDEAALARLLAR